MNWLGILGFIFLGIVIALLFMLVVVILGGVDVRPLWPRKRELFVCPKCGYNHYLAVFDTGKGTLHPKDYKLIPGLYRCSNCLTLWKRYGTGPLIEVFGTPVDKKEDDKYLFTKYMYRKHVQCNDSKEGGNHDKPNA